MKQPNIKIGKKHGRLIVKFDDEDFKTMNYRLRNEVSKLRDQYPEEAVMDVHMRKKVQSFIDDPLLRFDDGVKEVLEVNLRDAVGLETPLMNPTDFELQAYISNVGGLIADENMEGTGINITPGKLYPFSSGQYKFTENFTRNKPLWDDISKVMVMEKHKLTRTGIDMWLSFQDDDRKYHRFLAHPNNGSSRDHGTELLWTLFRRPKVDTVNKVLPVKYEENLDTLNCHEILSGFDYYPGQKDFIARVGTKDFGLVAAETGCGKTLIAISLSILKGAERVLVIAPKGTVKGSDGNTITYDPAQWEKELLRFAPHHKVHHIFNKEDMYDLMDENGDLPTGFFVSYPDAMFTNQSRETLPDSWDEIKFRASYGINIKNNLSIDYAEGVGLSNGYGVRCIATPTLSTLLNEKFDMIILDEAHLMQNLHAKKTQTFIRMQARYRFALSATPIPNIVSDMFALMGWLCVPDWYKNYKRNVAWPYDTESLGRFSSTFLVQERDHTEEALRGYYSKSGKKLRCVKTSPIIASPSRLLKLLKPTLSFISKKKCNPRLMPCEVKDVRVPMGKLQQKLYGYYTDRGNVPAANPLVRAMVQQSYLRNACADPGNLGGNKFSNFNPKTVAVLELILEAMERKEQIVVVSSRLGQTSEIEDRLRTAGVPYSRIDSSRKSDMHSKSASEFKQGLTKVMLMGIKMAQAFSFENCNNLVISSLEWSYAAKNQAMGRVWRLNSPKPVTVWCVLNENSIEEVMFDRVANKADAATLCLRGERVVNKGTVLDASEVIGNHIINYRDDGQTLSEEECEKQWPTLMQRLSIA